MTASRDERRRWEEQADEACLEAAREGRPGGHPEIDRRVLALTRIAVARIDERPELVRIGMENIRRWTRQKGGYLPRCHAEWKALIEQHPWERLREMLLRGVRRRPAAAKLTPVHRDRHREGATRGTRR